MFPILNPPPSSLPIPSLWGCPTNFFFFFLNIYLAALGLSCSIWNFSNCGIPDLVPWTGIEPSHPALGARSLSDWTTREVCSNYFLMTLPWVFTGFLGWVPRRSEDEKELVLLKWPCGFPIVEDCANYISQEKWKTSFIPLRIAALSFCQQLAWKKHRRTIVNPLTDQSCGVATCLTW